MSNRQSETYRDRIELKAIVDILADIASSLDLDECLNKIMEVAAETLEAEASSLLLLDKETDNLLFRAATGEKAEEVKKLSLKMGEGVAGWVAQNARPVLIEDASRDPRHKKDIAKKLDFQCKSIVAAPVMDGDRVIGAVEVINHRSGRPFDSRHLEHLKVLSKLIAIALRNAMAFKALNDENVQLRSALKLKTRIIGKHPAIYDALELVRRTAPYDITVLITGESGTGKELFARAIHDNSPRANGPFVAVNCTAIPDTLLESELFGHEKGAFTGAIATRKGKFELAKGGTLFLDEIGDMSGAAQSKVLRAIEERTFERVGGTKQIEMDVRIVAATNKNLPEMVKKGQFREDLFYRLNEFCISLPPLRERKEDIPLLAEHFLREFSEQFSKPIAGLAPDAQAVLLRYDWPGNIRELRNALKSAVILADRNRIGVEHLPLHIRQSAAEVAAASIPVNMIASAQMSLADVEKAHIARVLEGTGWNKSKAARILGISRPTLDAKIKNYGLTNTSEK